MDAMAPLKTGPTQSRWVSAMDIRATGERKSVSSEA